MSFPIYDDDGVEFWLSEDCAHYCGIGASTWSSYVSRGQAPAPQGHLNRNCALWNVDEVKAWHASRPRSNA
ncbi:hypothetical protein GSS88_11350 [Corynebacterium sp. 3HC-13]|uniref:helix-turn-helix transcriptional regulator n=1 Tax=Corynebacterium poyangense TaxID=2684405 RepID=UPI001CCB40E4|nr:hypothetical protein [Corynebacterium poyangense]MBZ8178373.1 hypothetical protein [Corynebacterium poyangense]